jgi:GDSL-like lipase/acylhydrolase family protein
VHVVLLGDSIFDNAAYVGRDPDVRTQLQAMLQGSKASSKATLLARDGATIAEVGAQLNGLPTDATHLVISAGGNDAIGAIGLLEASATSVADALAQLAAFGDAFRRDYAEMLDSVGARRLPTAVCTIYEPRFPEPELRRAAASALSLLNDQISREAFSRGLTMIDLRLVCDQDEDFANPIEPSAHGGAKIAQAILNFASGSAPDAAVFASN